ncbi:MAG: fibronectin type III-like domain-contianing protein, partial [Bacteroidales bacterium]|nr:fibronectin type III-like domain-contianing protein [Bacteroidales bacterium]
KYNPAGRTTQTWVKDIRDLPNLLDYDIRHGRTYMYFKGQALYPFGYGLSYTKFQYKHLKIKKDGDNYKVTFDLTNVGKMDGEEVVQLYATVPGDDAAKRLRGFDRVAVAKGETKKVEIIVPSDDLKIWDTEKHAFGLKKGKAKIQIGASSADIRLQKKVKVQAC